MKKIIFLITVFVMVFTSCEIIEDALTTTDYISPYATNVNGELVPKHENVEECSLEPSKFIKDEKGRMKYIDDNVKIIHGIDVSVFQGDINWSEVKNDGIDFVMLRLGYRGYGSKGIMQIDDNFYKNYDEAKTAGLDIGVYFYSQALNAAEAEEEAQFVLDTLEGRALDYPIAYDWEYVDNNDARTKNMTSAEITACAKAFCDYINSRNEQAIIYFNCELGYFEYDLSVLNMYDFWLAEYYEYPTFLYDYKMWQYTSSGHVKGIDSAVDINISLVDYSQTVNFG